MTFEKAIEKHKVKCNSSEFVQAKQTMRKLQSERAQQISGQELNHKQQQKVNRFGLSVQDHPLENMSRRLHLTSNAKVTGNSQVTNSAKAWQI